MMNLKEYEQIAPRLREKSLQTSRLLGVDDDDALDLAQDVLLKLWQMRHELGRFRSLDALVVVCTRHRAVDLYRQKSRLASLADVDTSLLSDRFTPLDELELAETSSWLHKKIRSLPDKEHTVLIMRQVEKRDYSEIALLLGIEETSARVLLARARKKLLQQFKQHSQ
ncbi:MAG: RNA polymerase sigma factor [Muribaculaceae bacterium]